MSTSTYPEVERMTRFVIYRSDLSKEWLCVVSARDRRHALKIARQTFYLTRTAYAMPEVR